MFETLFWVCLASSKFKFQKRANYKIRFKYLNNVFWIWRNEDGTTSTYLAFISQCYAAKPFRLSLKNIFVCSSAVIQR
jgi:hypothetical protein